MLKVNSAKQPSHDYYEEVMMKLIKLSNGLVTVVDDDDFDKFGNMNWTWNGRYVYKKINHKENLYLHRAIMKTPSDLQTDHKNGDPLDNRKENLRICTVSQNQANRPAPANNTSGFKGVYFRKNRKKFCARITVNQKIITIGCFDTALDAAKAYEKYAQKIFGEFSQTNIGG